MIPIISNGSCRWSIASWKWQADVCCRFLLHLCWILACAFKYLISLLNRFSCLIQLLSKLTWKMFSPSVVEDALCCPCRCWLVLTNSRHMAIVIIQLPLGVDCLWEWTIFFSHWSLSTNYLSTNYKVLRKLHFACGQRGQEQCKLPKLWKILAVAACMLCEHTVCSIFF